MMINLKLITALLLLIGVAITSAITDTSTGITFAPKKNGLEIFGVGVRKKGPIKVYSVALYGSSALKNTLSSISRSASKALALQTLQDSVKKDDDVAATFVLEMSFKVGAEKMASAISDSVAPRHTGNTNDVESLRQIVATGLENGATKGTTLQFDCSNNGISVAINGKARGEVPSVTLAKAFCDVYLDDNCVSPALRQSCLDNCCAP